VPSGRIQTNSGDLSIMPNDHSDSAPPKIESMQEHDHLNSSPDDTTQRNMF